MVDLEWKAKIVSSDMPSKSPKLSNKLHISVPMPPSFRTVQAEISTASSSSCSAYEHYLRLPELRKLWSSKEFPDWKNESILKPALQALEITFRFISIVSSDPRPYANQREWKRRLESLTTNQIEVIAMLCEDEVEDGETRGRAPIVDLSSSKGVLARDGSYAEVWKIPGETTVVSRTSEASLLPRLVTWQKSEDVAQKILYSLECEMRRCPYTLGLGEPNLAGKPNLDYDLVCKPAEVHSLKKSPYDFVGNYENQTVYTTHQLLESWIFVSQELLRRVADRVEGKDFEKASSDCYMIERIWKLLAEIEDLHLLMDPDDFLRLKNQLGVKSMEDSEAFCFRSKALVEIAKQSKDLKHKVPNILGVEVDPKGGPRIQEAAMKLYSEKKGFEKIHLLQALQAIESALKRFFYAYKQVLVIVMGSLEAKGNRVVVSDACDSLSQIFLEPTYFPSLDAAKTFLGDILTHEHGGVHVLDRRTRRKQSWE
ncbi:nematode resistance protein-like HSPRO2 [Ziziphus jujuba]|uniref:Nematode resistance protein-like HSPRO2 n=1 Tax=Ziziphus jujuba TaxID=326968 RepID=A0ABM3IDS0_ZIZJJ|nr:nematode resistance protein-like HSPRO2 [Ziziphus jujuba]